MLSHFLLSFRLLWNIFHLHELLYCSYRLFGSNTCTSGFLCLSHPPLTIFPFIFLHLFHLKFYFIRVVLLIFWIDFLSVFILCHYLFYIFCFCCSPFYILFYLVLSFVSRIFFHFHSFSPLLHHHNFLTSCLSDWLFVYLPTR